MPEDENAEPNLYVGTLQGCQSTLIPSCQQAVHDGAGSPADSIATPLGAGGWECTEATNWLAELTEHCSGILEAFEDAAHDVGAAIKAEHAVYGSDDRVPADHPHGYAWSRSWSMQRRLNVY